MHCDQCAATVFFCIAFEQGDGQYWQAIPQIHRKVPNVLTWDWMTHNSKTAVKKKEVENRTA